jgi:hypothetical protein
MSKNLCSIYHSRTDALMPKADDSLFSGPQSDDDVWLDDIGDTLKLDNTEVKTPDPETIPQPASKADRSGPTQMSVEQWLESLRRTDRTFYNMMAMEVWSIAKSMDSLIPGFWSRFMENRQTAVKKFVRDRRTPDAGLRLEDLDTPENLNSDPSQN